MEVKIGDENVEGNVMQNYQIYLLFTFNLSFNIMLTYFLMIMSMRIK